MCTAISLKKKKHYFGRNLDLDCSYGEEVCITPRSYPLRFRKREEIPSHYAIIGMATVVNGEPLYYDAANEHGLCMAGLNFPRNAYYPPFQEGKDNVTPFELIPWILGQCKEMAEVRTLLSKLRLVGIAYSESLPLSPLHWIVADGKETLVVEPTKEGLQVYDNPVGVLTNNPPFPYHLQNLSRYRSLKTDNGANTFGEKLPLEEYCQGLGAVGLPGDLSSPSRFVRMAFHKTNAVCGEEETACVSQFFHLLTSVEMPRGSCKVPSGEYDITVYSACVNASEGKYYYTTYGNRQIGCVDMHRTDLSGKEIYRFPLVWEEQIRYEN